MVQAMETVLNDKALNILYQENSGYAGGTREIAQRVFGTDYYQLHPFVFERLAPAIYGYLKANISYATFHSILEWGTRNGYR